MTGARATAWWLGVAAGAAVWAVCVADALGFFDAGELAAAAVGPGVPHPSGFPVFLLLGQLARLLPFATLAGRVHTAGALLVVAAAAVTVVALVGRSRLRGAGETATAGASLGLAGLGVALLVPSADTLALHVRQTEVYPLVLMHAAAVIALFRATTGARLVIGCAALVGLGAGVHAESVGLAALGWLWAMAAWWWQRRRAGGAALAGRAALRVALMSAPAAALAATSIAALPLIAARAPALDWGGVDGAATLCRHLSGASIRAAFADQQGVDLAGAARALATTLWRDLGPLWALAAVGAGVALRGDGADDGADHGGEGGADGDDGDDGARSRRVAAVALALVAADAAWAVVVNPMGIRDGQVGLLVELGAGCFAAFAVIDLALRWRRAGRPILATLALLGLTLLGASSWGRTLSALPPAALHAAARYGDTLIDAIPPGGLAVAASDHVASACVWMQAAEGARPDASCLPLVFSRDVRTFSRIARRLDQPSWRDAAIAASAATSARERARALGIWLRPYAAADALRWEPGQAFEDAQLGSALRSGFPWGRVAMMPAKASETTAEAAAMVTDYQQHCAELGSGCGAGTPLRRHLGSQLGVWGARLLASSPTDGAAVLHGALALDAGNARAWHNLAVARLAAGAPAEAVALARRALAANPRYRGPQRVLARAYARLGDDDGAVEAARAALGARLDAGRRRWLRGLVDELRAGGQRALADRVEALAPAEAARAR